MICLKRERLKKFIEDGFGSRLFVFNPAKEWTGVYFLVLNEEVVYIGQSQNVFARISNHKSNKVQFDNVMVFFCDAQKVYQIEQALIKILKPRYNKTKAARLSEKKAFAILKDCEFETFDLEQEFQQYKQSVIANLRDHQRDFTKEMLEHR